MNKFWDWLVTSSADPEKTALTVKGGLTAVISWVVYVSPLLKLHTDNLQLDNVASFGHDIVLATLAIVASVVAFIGLVRKIYNTFR